MTSYTYVIPDLHGRFDLLEKALHELETYQEPGRVIFLGDYIDRGPASYQVVERVMAGPQQAGWRWDALRGNHEDMLVQVWDPAGYFRSRDEKDWYYACGGEATFKSYPDGQPTDEHLAWMMTRPTVFWDDHRVYVHAGVNEAHELNEQTEQTTQWYRYPASADVGYRDRHVVHGHTPSKFGPFRGQNRTNLDCGAFFTDRLVVGVFDNDRPGGPVKLFEFNPTSVE